MWLFETRSGTYLHGTSLRVLATPALGAMADQPAKDLNDTKEDDPVATVAVEDDYVPPPRNPPSSKSLFSLNNVTTLLYSLSFFVMGLCLSMLGPALLSLSYQINASLKETSLSFTVRSVGYALGSLLTGPLFDRFPGHITLGTCLVGAGLGTILLPIAHNIGSLCAITAFQGFGMGAVDTGANVMIVWMYEDKVGPYMQTLHFAYALGAALGPLLLRAFFKAIEGNDVTGNYSGAFYLTGAMNLVVGIALWFVRSPKQREHELVGNLESAVGELVDEKLEKGATDPTKEEMELSPSAAIVQQPAAGPGELDQSTFATYHSRRSKLIILETFLIFWLLFLYVGSETGYGGFVTSYVVLALGSTEETGQLLASVYWWAITAGRLASSRYSDGCYERMLN